MESERKLLKEVLEDKATYQIPIKALKTAYASFEMGDLDDQQLDGILQTGTEDICTRYMQSANKEIESTGIKSNRLKDILLESCKQAVAEFNEAYQGLIDAVLLEIKKRKDKVILSKQLICAGSGFEKRYAFSNEPGKKFKQLTIGKNSWVSTKCNKSWALEYSTIRFTPDKGDVYIYAKCPADNSPGTLEVHYQLMPNTPKDYMILIVSGSYDDINF